MRAACSLDCWDTCTFLVEVSGGRVTGLRGDPDHPVTAGRLCPKARFQLDRHRSASRLLRPLVRSRGELRTASWTAALDLVAERLLEARRRSGSLSVLHYWDSGSMGVLKGLYQRLFNLFGGVTEPHGSLCWSAGLAAQEADFGRALSNLPEDHANAAAIVIWGRNPADTNVHIMRYLQLARDRGAPIVVVDPRETATARQLGARHVAPRPGTDAILALAVAGELIRRGKYDRAFCEDRAAGFDEFAVAARRAGVEEGARAAGVAPADILGLADLLETRHPVAFLLGYGVQRYAHGGEAVRAIDALAALTGNVGVPGGGANYANRHAAGLLRDLTGEEFATARRFFDRAAFGRQVREMGIEVLFCDRANPVAQLPNTNLVVETCKGIGFKAVVELRPTDTAALADVVLPAADFLEDEDLLRCSWHPYFTWGVPAVSPRGEAWPETRIIAELAARLGFGGEFRRTPAEWIAYALRPLAERHPELAPGGDVSALRGTSFANPEAPAVPWSNGRFATPSGRFEFGRRWPSLEGLGGARKAAAGGGDVAATAAATATEQAVGLAPGQFHLISPQHRFSLHSQFYEEVLKRTSPRADRPAIFVHPAAARRLGLGLSEGLVVTVKSAQGELEACLVFDAGLREDTACLYSGGTAGYTGSGQPASANLLTPDHLTDMGVQAAFYDCVCVIAPVTPAG